MTSCPLLPPEFVVETYSPGGLTQGSLNRGRTVGTYTRSLFAIIFLSLVIYSIKLLYTVNLEKSIGCQIVIKIIANLFTEAAT